MKFVVLKEIRTGEWGPPTIVPLSYTSKTSSSFAFINTTLDLSLYNDRSYNKKKIKLQNNNILIIRFKWHFNVWNSHFIFHLFILRFVLAFPWATFGHALKSGFEITFYKTSDKQHHIKINKIKCFEMKLNSISTRRKRPLWIRDQEKHQVTRWRCQNELPPRLNDSSNDPWDDRPY